MKIRQAEMKDFDGFMSLLKAYHTNYISDEDRPDGFVTTNFTPQNLEELIVKERGVTVAENTDGKIVAFATAGPWEFWAQWPLFTHMIEILPGFALNGQTLGTENSYQYGPICVDKYLRGSGLFERIFLASLQSMRDRYPYMVTFINQINPRSIAAHTNKVRMSNLGTFQFNTNNYYLLACPTTPTL